MKTPIRELFKNNFKFVKPLYRKAKYQNKSERTGVVPFSFDRTVKLDGQDFDVKTIIKGNVRSEINEEHKVALPGACDSGSVRHEAKLNKLYNKIINERCAPMDTLRDNFVAMIGRSVTDRTHNRVNSLQIFPQVAETWLRICPAPKVPGESICSVVIRCVLCQVGLATFLTIWTLVAVFLIESFEGPNELQVSLNFERDQNQLVIDLATELRQITPISPKWRYAIERRIEDERRLTMNAVGLGAQIKSGCFWNLSGTFLFTVYVMTALGFGAPVPHTVWGRTLALVYAILAVPTHIYLMMNASTYVAIKVESYTRYLEIEKNTRPATSANTSINREKNSTSSAKPNKPFCTRTIIRCMKVALVGRCVPITIFSYYLLGVVCFGVLRNKNSLECIMFPLEFTTTGGLALVNNYVRILYGLYIEGAMYLFACTVASIRRNTNITLEHLGERYRLFEKNTTQQ